MAPRSAISLTLSKLARVRHMVASGDGKHHFFAVVVSGDQHKVTHRCRRLGSAVAGLDALSHGSRPKQVAAVLRQVDVRSAVDHDMNVHDGIGLVSSCPSCERFSVRVGTACWVGWPPVPSLIAVAVADHGRLRAARRSNGVRSSRWTPVELGRRPCLDGRQQWQFFDDGAHVHGEQSENEVLRESFEVVVACCRAAWSSLGAGQFEGAKAGSKAALESVSVICRCVRLVRALLRLL